MRKLPHDYPPIDPNERGIDWWGNALMLIFLVELIIGRFLS